MLFGATYCKAQNAKKPLKQSKPIPKLCYQRGISGGNLCLAAVLHACHTSWILSFGVSRVSAVLIHKRDHQYSVYLHNTWQWFSQLFLIVKLSEKNGTRQSKLKAWTRYDINMIVVSLSKLVVNVQSGVRITISCILHFKGAFWFPTFSSMIYLIFIQIFSQAHLLHPIYLRKVHSMSRNSMLSHAFFGHSISRMFRNLIQEQTFQGSYVHHIHIHYTYIFLPWGKRQLLPM